MRAIYWMVSGMQNSRYVAVARLERAKHSKRAVNIVHEVLNVTLRFE